MSEPVKKHAYSSPVRQQQAAQTRDRIVDAAALLLVEHGYTLTTVRDIAEAAGTAVDTVYAAFGTKARVLTALIDARLAPGSGSVLERPEARAVRDAPDQHLQLHLMAHDIAGISARVRTVYEIMRTASAVDPEMATVFAEMDGYRLRNMRQFVAWVAARGPLCVPEERAAEIVWAVASPDVARMLCDVRGWTQDEYAAWLEESLVRLLLP